MKAIVCEKYGPPEALELKEVDKPVPKDNEALIKAYATSINSWDWDILTGKPYTFRFFHGLLKPKNAVIGCDVAGRVESVGEKVEIFKAGDDVIGDLSGDGGFGCFADYVCADENLLSRKPAGITFEEAAAIPQAAVLALQGLRFNGEIQPGQKVLLNGAGGGVGTYAVQMAKSMGAEVTCVDRAEKLDRLRLLGADHVIDYTKEDFTKNGLRYDLILDVAANRSVFEYESSLNPEGGYAVIGGSIGSIMQTVFLGPLISRFRGKKLGVLMHKPGKDDLDHIKGLFEVGEIKSLIDKSYPFNEVHEALKYYGEGHFVGKIVISIEHDS